MPSGLYCRPDGSLQAMSKNTLESREETSPLGNGTADGGSRDASVRWKPPGHDPILKRNGRHPLDSFRAASIIFIDN